MVLKKLRWFVWVNQISVLLILGSILLLSVVGWAGTRTLGPLRLTLPHLGNQKVAAVLHIDLGQDVGTGVKAVLAPNAAGSWREVKDVLGVNALEFTPHPQLEAGQTYEISISGLRRLATGHAIPDQTVLFSTVPAPNIAGFTPAADQADMPVIPTFTLTLAGANHNVRRPVLTLTPAVTTAQTDATATSFSWRPVTPLAQGTTYRITVDDQNVITQTSHRRLVDRSFTTVAAPKVVSATQGGHFYPGNHVTVVFSTPMKPAPNPLQFDMPGSGSWANPTTYVFTPSGLVPGSAYAYHVLKAGISVAGGVMEADQTFAIAPPGHAVVTGAGPGGGGVSLSAPISLSFDQPMDHTSVQSKFGVVPGMPGSFSWSGNTLTFAPAANYDYQTTYSYSLASGAASSYGLSTAAAFSGSFTTALQTIRLGVPTYRQTYALSCESSALRMVLAYRGISVTDLDVLNHLGYAPRSRDTSTNTWDNPYDMFVGDIIGAQNTTGYGVYAGPIAAAAQAFGRTASSYTGVSASFISTHIHNNEPVIIWGYNQVAILDSWNTSSGPVSAWKGEHARVVIGVVGNAANPAGFYVNDPATGTQYYWTTSQLLSNLNVFGNLSNQAVVVD